VAEPFKNLINPALVRTAGLHLHRAWPGFDRTAFEAQALEGLEAIEMKARAMQVADALEATLPADFDTLASVIESALAPPDERGGDAVGTLGLSDAGLAGWIVWSLGEVVARRGLAHPTRALACLRELTMRFSAEFAIRPFIVAHPALTFDTLHRWTRDHNAHVRRLVSEGSRPRLPWGLRLQALVADPSPTLPLLAALQDDPSDYVRRSVANHLNDIAKDHPDLVVDWVARHLPDATVQRRALLSHASRTLIKQGHAAMLEAWGVGAAFDGEVSFAAAPSPVTVGEPLRLEVTVRATGTAAQRLVIDYAVHRPLADGRLAPKVFKGWTLTLAPRESRTLAKTHSTRPVTTRIHRPGRHEIELRVNGRALARVPFVLRAP
jgi:3-methyladenine DNA glycosylase AlkC